MHQNPKYFDVKAVFGCLKEAENHDCSLWAGFCSCIRHFAPLMLSLSMTHAAGIGALEQAALKWQLLWSITAPFWTRTCLNFFFNSKLLLPTGKNTQLGKPKGWASLQAALCRCCTDLSSLWCCSLIVPHPCSSRLWHVLSDSRSQEMVN